MTVSTLAIRLLMCIGVLCTASDTKWGQWEPKLCWRQCTDPFGLGEYQRDCLLCSETYSCNATNPSQCDGPAKEVSSCYVANECTGDGVYTGQMSPWIPVSLCPDPKLSCTGKVRIFNRTCQRTDKSRPGEFKCPGDKFTERKENCVCGVNDPAAIAVSDPHWGWLPRYGVWSEWSEWNCEQPCVNVTRRTRQCKKNPSHLFDCPMDAEGRLHEDVMPCRIDGKPLCRNQGEEVLCPGGSCLNDWSSWTEWSSCIDGCEVGQMRRRDRKCLNAHAQCFGLSEDLKSCPRNETFCKTGHHRIARDATPVDGGWTEYGPLLCGYPCGRGGLWAKGRTCTNPWPEHHGKHCTNANVHTVGGCNLGDCPQEIDAKQIEELTKVNNRGNLLFFSYYTTDLPVGNNVRIVCGNVLLNLSLKFDSTAKVTWSRNGVAFTPEQPKYEYVEEIGQSNFLSYITIFNVRISDAGVYQCHVTGNWPRTMMAVALTVSPTPIVEVYHNTPLELNCYGDYFKDLIPGLEYIWKHNDSLVGEYGPIASSKKTIDNVKPDDAGLWECFIIQAVDQCMVKTNSLQLSVLDPSTRKQEDKYVKTKVFKAILAVFALAKLTLVALISYLYYRNHKQHKNHV